MSAEQQVNMMLMAWCRNDAAQEANKNRALYSGFDGGEAWDRDILNY
jgi:hypothetical protein